MDLLNRLSSVLRNRLILVVFLLSQKSFTQPVSITRPPFGTQLVKLKPNHLTQLTLMLSANSEFLLTQKTTITSLLDGTDSSKSGLFLVNALPLSEPMTDQSML